MRSFLKILYVLCTGANSTAEAVHAQSFTDWLGTIDVLIKESTALYPDDVQINSSFLAKHFGMGIGGVMQYYSVWFNLHPAALKNIISWGDIDYEDLARKHNIPMTAKRLELFDKVDVVNKTAFYPKVWKKLNQTEAFQVIAAERILLYHLRMDPPGPLNKAKVLDCLKWVSEASDATEALEKILAGARESITFNQITEIDGSQVISQCQEMLKKLANGDLDGDLKKVGDFPSSDIRSLHYRLDGIRTIAEQRRKAQRLREEKVAEVLLFLFYH